PAPPLQMAGSINGDPILLRFDPWFAGAVSELRFRGKSYVNAADHGRLIQSAVSFDGWGECLNPTEAGSVADGRQRRTTSILLSARVEGASAQMRTRMAYWMPPGAGHRVNPKDLQVRSSAQPCREDGRFPEATRARNGTAVSDVVLDKRIALRKPNMLVFDVGFELPRAYRQAMFEALTAYLEPEFDRFYAFERKSGSLLPVKPQLGGARPLVVATRDGKHALGITSGRSDLLFAAFRWPDTSKLNCFAPKEPAKAGKHRFSCTILVGTLEEVRSSLVRLHAARDGS
ncbi:MAG TPA: hypothetical protein VNT25_06660, partial [Allosphingosinicella sp.]|nr:hypothetical protein [Allosphingosinicella sp.]